MDEVAGGFGVWLPIDISTHGAGVDRLIIVLHAFMAILFVGWAIFLVYCLVRFRSRGGCPARYELPKAKPSKYAEIAVVIIEAFLLIGLSMPVWANVKNEIPQDKEATLVQVVAEQFAWNFHYPGADGLFGKTHSKLMGAENPAGLDREKDPQARDDIVTINQLHVPVNKPVRLQLRSKDVIHSFSIPVLRVKQDVIPGMDIPTWFQARQTGKFDIACAQLCGLGHYRMKGQITIESPEQFQAWLAQEAAWMEGKDEEEVEE